MFGSDFLVLVGARAEFAKALGLFTLPLTHDSFI
jgi:hypothetical protein